MFDQKIKIWIAGILILATASCEQILIPKDPANNPVNNFELLWKTVGEKYSYFELKDIDWDEVYSRYRPRVNDQMSESELFALMAEMLYELRDGHVNLISDFDISRNWQWYLDHPQNFNFSLIERNYLGNDYRISGPFRTREIQGVGYLYYGSFMNDIPDETLDDVLRQYAGSNGLIIDIRDNGGGRIDLVKKLISRFVSEETTVGYTRYKNGSGRDDFTPYYPVKVGPEGFRYPKPVVILTNRSVYSAANEFAAFIGSLPNVDLIGDIAGGGGGAPYSGELMNGWSFRFSATQTFNVGREHIEHGVTPFIRVDMAPQDEINGVDTILETALLYLNL